MSISQDNGATILCQEVFDGASQPSYDEILDYAKRLGINPDAEPYLLPLAKEGLMAALPEGWQPCYLETQDAWYYYHADTEITTWEHPLDATYKQRVQEMRIRHNKQQNTDNDSSTTIEERRVQSDTSLQKEPTTANLPMLQTKMPTKLKALKTVGRESSRRKNSRKTSNSESINTNTPTVEHSTRNYDLCLHDPKLHESQIELNNSEAEINLQEIVKRSESSSRRYDKQREDLSNKFTSEENIIDIDKLSISSLTKSDSQSLLKKPDNESNQNQSSNQKELLLNGGGTMFLKSSRSRDRTPNHDEDKSQDFHLTNIPSGLNDLCSDVIETPKSILREKFDDDEDRPIEEERKSVRFDLEKDLADVNLMYSDLEDTAWDSHPIDKQSDIRTLKHQLDLAHRVEGDSDSSHTNVNWLETDLVREGNASSNVCASAKIVGRRFLVENVSEAEHMRQILTNYGCNNDLSHNKATDVKTFELTGETKSTPVVSAHGDQCSASNIVMISPKSGRKIILTTKEAARRCGKSEIHTVDIGQTDAPTEPRQVVRNDNKNIKNVMYEMWAQNEIELIRIGKVFQEQLENKRKELELHINKQQSCMRKEMENRLIQMKHQLAEEETKEMQILVTQMEGMKTEKLQKLRSELEMCYEKEHQNILQQLTAELNERKKEVVGLRNNELKSLIRKYENNPMQERVKKITENELTREYDMKIATMKKELDKEFGDLRDALKIQHREKISEITKNHEKCLADVLRDFRLDGHSSRKVYEQQLNEIHSDLSRGIDKKTEKIPDHAIRQQIIDFQKIRCEKRLLEDKYKVLKEKYSRLKSEIRGAMERRMKRRESNAMASETERSASTKTQTKKTNSGHHSRTSSQNVSSKSRAITSDNHNAEDDTEQNRLLLAFRSRGDQSAVKCESDDPTTASETMNSDLLEKRKTVVDKAPSTSEISHRQININNTNNNDNSIQNPVDNIRKQLEKLEDLGDQLPSDDTAYTLRYPFKDKAPVNASSELEFFRHRIHVERDSIKRAQEALRIQRNIFQGRQRVWKQRSTKATLEQLIQEERELSEMEVDLHRTRSLLGEKIIHLKHSERSLNRLVNAKKNGNHSVTLTNDELTLSDISSASSGFSSTDFCADTLVGFGAPNIHSNILSHLTAKLPSATTQNIITQYGLSGGFTTSVGTVERTTLNLTEKTRNMRDWLRQTRMQSTNPVSPEQTTL